MLILGCDTGLLNLGVAVIDRQGNPLYLESFLFPKVKTKSVNEDRRDRTQAIVKKLTALLDKYPEITEIAMEMPHRAPNLTGIVTTTLAVGALITLGVVRGIPVTPLLAQAVRARVFGKPIEDDEMYQILRDKPGVTLTNTPPSRASHALDAYATALYLITPEEPNARSTKKPAPKAAPRKGKPRVGKGRKKKG